MTDADPLLGIEAADELGLTADGRIVDFLDPTIARANTPEERVRQTYGRRLHFEYGYPKSLIRFEAPISIGSEKKSADIAVYEDEMGATMADQARIRLIVETKAPNITKGVGQLKSYIFASSAEGGVWVNQTDAPKYYHRAPGSKLEDWPNIPKYDEPWDAIGHQTKAGLKPPHNLVEIFRRCHNALYKVGIDSEDLAMDMVRIILAKYQDEINEGDNPEFRVTPFELQHPQGRARVAARVRALFTQVRDDHRDVFDEHERISAGEREIAVVVSELQGFRFLSPDDSDEVYDVVGAAYEVYIGSHLKGDRGQYFTHRLIVSLLVRMVNPKESDVILDPAMGSGGFLVNAMRNVGQSITESKRSAQAKRAAVAASHTRLFGIDKSPKLVKVGRTNMILASDGHSGLVHGDTLEIKSLQTQFGSRMPSAGPTVILTNPPFGATNEHRLTPDREPDILAQFDVARVWKMQDGRLRPSTDFLKEGVPPEYLFVERCLRWVAPGGRIGIVVPRGLLDNDKALALRTLMLDEAKLIAVVNCHDDTFKPHTDAKAALLILERKDAQVGTDADDYPIFMAISQGIGHNGVGEPIYRTDAKGDQVLVEGAPVLEEDTAAILAAWESARSGGETGSGYYFMATRSQITASLNLNPVRYLPRYVESRRKVNALKDVPGWTVKELGEIADVFNGPRFKRPYADKGVTSGPKIVRYFTGNAMTQTRGENIKYLDLEKAKPTQLRMIDQLYLRRGMILVTDSGTVGRVVYATQYHDGAVGTNNLIRVVVADEALRGYVYQFLTSQLGQDQLKANIYGAIVDHIEPHDVSAVRIPVPDDPDLIESIGRPVIESIELQENAQAKLDESEAALASCVEAGISEDE